MASHIMISPFVASAFFTLLISAALVVAPTGTGVSQLRSKFEQKNSFKRQFEQKNSFKRRPSEPNALSSSLTVSQIRSKFEQKNKNDRIWSFKLIASDGKEIAKCESGSVRRMPHLDLTWNENSKNFTLQSLAAVEEKRGGRAATKTDLLPLEDLSQLADEAVIYPHGFQLTEKNDKLVIRRNESDIEPLTISSVEFYRDKDTKGKQKNTNRESRKIEKLRIGEAIDVEQIAKQMKRKMYQVPEGFDHKMFAACIGAKTKKDSTTKTGIKLPTPQEMQDAWEAHEKNAKKKESDFITKFKALRETNKAATKFSYEGVEIEIKPDDTPQVAFKKWTNFSFYINLKKEADQKYADADATRTGTGTGTGLKTKASQPKPSMSRAVVDELKNKLGKIGKK